MAFNADTAIEKLDWDFHPYLDAKGTTPEPTVGQIKKFQQDIREVVTKYLPEGAEEMPNDQIEQELRKRLAGVTEAEQDEQYEASVRAVAAVCSECPSFDQIRQLPARVQQHFMGYMTGLFLRPEA